MAALVRENMGVFLNLKLNCSYEGMKYIPSILRLPAIRYWRGKESGHVTCGRGALVYFIEEYVKVWIMMKYKHFTFLSDVSIL